MVGAGVGGTATHLILMTDPQAQDLVLAGMIFSENGFHPRIKSGQAFFGSCSSHALVTCGVRRDPLSAREAMAKTKFCLSCQ